MTLLLGELDVVAIELDVFTVELELAEAGTIMAVEDTVDALEVLLAQAAGAEPMPGVNGWTSTRVRLIQLVVVKKVPSWNCATVASVNCSEKLARLQIEEPGP